MSILQSDSIVQLLDGLVKVTAKRKLFDLEEGDEITLEVLAAYYIACGQDEEAIRANFHITFY